MVKGDRGVIGITENETALRRWMVAGPETARLLTEYEEKHSRKKKESEPHHEQIPSVQQTLLAQNKNVTDVIEELGSSRKVPVLAHFTIHMVEIIQLYTDQPHTWLGFRHHPSSSVFQPYVWLDTISNSLNF